jgi:hypothetical protein
MQVCRGPSKSNIDVITTDLEGFIVQRLVNVANKVDDKPERVVDFSVTQSCGNNTLSVICNSTEKK